MIHIRPAGEGDLDVLTDIWERGARSTHHFMDDEDFAEARPVIRDRLLPSMEVSMAEVDGTPVGFIGVRETHVVLLYLEPEYTRRGIGTALLRHADTQGPLSVEVYADNHDGMAFYRRSGFVESRRLPRDTFGRPFPVVHLTR